MWLVLKAIFPIIFNVLFFVVGGFEHNASVWISYGFIHFAYIMLLLTPKFIHSGKSSAIFGFSLFSISSFYFVLEFIVGMVFIVVAPESFKLAFLIQFIIAGLCVAMFVSHMIANEHTAKAQAKRQVEINYLKGATVRVKMLLVLISDKDAKKSVERVYDVLDSSPVKSYPDLAEKEQRILKTIDELESAVQQKNNEAVISTAKSLLFKVNERNNLLSALH